MKKVLQFVCVACACLFVLSPMAVAALATDTISATSAATEVSPGVWEYNISVAWEYDPTEPGVSHLDFDLTGCIDCAEAVWDEWGELTGNIYMGTEPFTYSVGGTEYSYAQDSKHGATNGYDSTGEVYSTTEVIPWHGVLEDDGTGKPIFRYEQMEWSPSQPDPLHTQYELWTDGTGTFTYYSLFAPKTATEADGAFVEVKAGKKYTLQGAITGDVPDCSPVPEPASLAILGLGAGVLVLGRRKNKLA